MAAKKPSKADPAPKKKPRKDKSFTVRMEDDLADWVEKKAGNESTGRVLRELVRKAKEAEENGEG